MVSSKIASSAASPKHDSQTYNAARNTVVAPVSSQPRTSYVGSNRPGIKSRSSRVTTSREMESRRVKGLCYWCPEKYVPGHKCHGKQLFVIEVGEDEEDDPESKGKVEGGTELTAQKEEVPELSLHVISGIANCSTMRVEGRANNRTLQLLIDSGSTHSFLDESVAETLSCVTETVPSLRVLVANCNAMRCHKRCKEFKWSMQGHHFATSVYLVPLDNYHVVLGIQYLATLEDILWNFRTLTMKFRLKQKQCELKGTISGFVHLNSSEKRDKLLSKSVDIAAIQLCSISVGSNTGSYSHVISAQVSEGEGIPSEIR